MTRAHVTDTVHRSPNGSELRAPMANIKSQKKRNITNEKRRVRNKTVRSELKTRVKQADDAIATGSDDAAETLKLAQKRIAKAGSKGIVHKNQASRRISRIMKRAAKASAGS